MVLGSKGHLVGGSTNAMPEPNNTKLSWQLSLPTQKKVRIVTCRYDYGWLHGAVICCCCCCWAVEKWLFGVVQARSMGSLVLSMGAILGAVEGCDRYDSRGMIYHQVRGNKTLGQVFCAAPLSVT